MTSSEGEKAGVENPRLYFRTDNDKSNLTSPSCQSVWFKIENAVLPNGPLSGPGDRVGAVVQWKWPAALEGVTDNDFERVAAAIGERSWRENSQVSDRVGKPIAEALGLDLENKADRAKVMGIIKAWLKAKKLVVVEAPDGKRMKRKFIKVAK